MTTRVLVLASDVPPTAFGIPAHGGGLRGWTLAEGLRSDGFEVRLRFPRESLVDLDATHGAMSAQDLDDLSFSWNDPLASYAVDRPDVVVISSWLLAGHITSCPAPLVVDLAGPVLFEFLAQSPEKALELAHHKSKALARADFVTCAGQRQRHYFLAWLALSGFTPADCAERLAVVPISCQPETPVRAPASREPRFVFAGLPLAWQDPVGPLDALLTRLEDRGQGRLDVYMERHPVHSAGVSWFPWLEQRLARSDRAALHAAVPYERLLALYGEVDVAFDVFERGIERELAVSTRTIDYLRAGVVPLMASFVELAESVGECGAGMLLAPPFETSMAAAVDLLLDEPGRIATMSANAQRLARERFAWDNTIEPLAAFCRNPTRRVPGALSPRALTPELVALSENLRRHSTSLEAQVHARDEEIAKLRGYAARVERAWSEQGAMTERRESELGAWRRHPWRMAIATSADAVARRLRRGEPGRGA